MQPSWIATVWAGVFAAAVHASDADLIITHARVLTQDTDNPRAEAVAIADGRLLAVGGEDGSVSVWGLAGALDAPAGAPVNMFCGAAAMP